MQCIHGQSRSQGIGYTKIVIMRYLGAGAKRMTPWAVHIYASRITFTSICVVTQSRSKRLRLLSCHLGLSANYCASVSDLSNFTSAIIAHSPNTARLHYLHSLSSSVLHMCIDIGLFIRDSLSLTSKWPTKPPNTAPRSSR